MLEELEYLNQNNIIIDVSKENSNNAVVLLNGIIIFNSIFIHHLNGKLENKVYRYKSINEHEDLIKKIKKEILKQKKTFKVFYSYNIISILYPEKEEVKEIDGLLL